MVSFSITEFAPCREEKNDRKKMTKERRKGLGIKDGEGRLGRKEDRKEGMRQEG